MIQSSYNQPIAPKASPEVKSKPASSAKPKDQDSAVKSDDFESELKAANGEEAPKTEKSEKSEKAEVTKSKSNSKKADSENTEGEEVKAIQVSAEMILENPTELLKAQPDSAGQKVFDPALTEDVQNILQPKSTEAAPVKLTDEQVLKLAEGEVPAVEGQVNDEIAQAMLKTPQVQAGRSPAIEFAQSEIDPQLLGNEDFVAQKNLAAKKTTSTSPYGMNKPQLQKLAMENGLKQTQIVKDIAAVEGSAQGPMNSQQFILNMKTDQGQKVQDTQAPQKVFDMSHIKTSNSNEVMDQISNYIIQAKAAKEPTVTMRVNHEELGMLDITVQKSIIVGSDAVAINIGAHSLEGKNFFQQNSKELFSHLTSAGVNVSDFKVDTSSQTAKNDFDTNQQQQSGRQGSEGKQFGSEQNQRRQESERRQDLWKLLADKEAA